jgi:hypothetical protein
MFWSIGRIPQAKKPALLLLLSNLFNKPNMQLCPNENVTLPVSLTMTIFLNQPVKTLWSQPAELQLQVDGPIMNLLPPRASKLPKATVDEPSNCQKNEEIYLNEPNKN